jgi:succinate dehydrogenase / fumarate reductase membrane anchor subunit
MTSYRTALSRVRGLGSAKSGTHHWWMQRITAIAGLPLVVVSLGIIYSLAGADYATAYARLSYPPVTIVFGLSFLVLLKHMRLGMQVILEDYVHGAFWKPAVLLANLFFTYAAGAAAAYALLKLSFGV